MGNAELRLNTVEALFERLANIPKDTPQGKGKRP
jgi:transcription-repair coupling factor (superfamily II helicase)